MSPALCLAKPGQPAICYLNVFAGTAGVSPAVRQAQTSGVNVPRSGRDARGPSEDVDAGGDSQLSKCTERRLISP
jgi:hypothetical protein